MSAIFGMIHLNNEQIDQTIPKELSECSKKYKIDRENNILDRNIFFSCWHQFNTGGI